MTCSRSALLAFVAILFMLTCTPESTRAQSHRIVPLDHWSYDYIERLQRRGHLLDLHPTALPYTHGEIHAAIDRLRRSRLAPVERAWVADLKRAFGPAERGRHVRRPSRHRSGRTTAMGGGELEAGLRVANSDRLDPLRYLDAEGATLEAAGLNWHPNAAGRLFLEYGPVVAQIGLAFDTFYRDDPDGLDVANRLIVRNDESYVGLGSQYASLYLGRFGHHWAPARDDALLLSNNAAEFDHLHVRLGGKRLALRSVLGELDAMTVDGRFTGTAGADSVAGSVRRFLSAHRLDWRPSRRFSISIMESTIYSSSNSGLSLKFLNPLNLHAFAVDGRPKNDENNGLLAGMLWFQFQRVTVQGQLLLDDIDLMGRTGEPPSAALAGSIVYAGRPEIDIGGRLTTVTARAYNTHQPEGRYINLLRGLGTQFSDYVMLSGFGTLYHRFERLDAAVTPKLDLLWQGERDIRQPYPQRDDDVETILTGATERLTRPAIEVRLQTGRHFWMSLDAGVLFSDRPDHGARFTFLLSMKARLGIADRINLAF